MRVVNPSTWRFTYKNNSEAIGTEIWVLAANRKSMTRTYSGRHENGEEFSQATTLKRTGGTAGFEGTWESTQMNLSFSEIDIAPNGDNGISTHVVADETKYSLHFDGKEYPEVGPRIPAGLTISARMAGARSGHQAQRQGVRRGRMGSFDGRKDLYLFGAGCGRRKGDFGGAAPLAKLTHSTGEVF
jgi:hypothetical protein